MPSHNGASKRVGTATRLMIVFAVLLLVLAPLPVSAEPSLSAADIIQKYRRLIPQLMAEQDIPGLSVAVVDDTKVLWAEGFGFTDDDHKVAVTPDTIFSVQSTSKTFTAVSVMLAVQEGLLDLDTPITAYLPDFTVHSIFEEHPEDKITLRRLLGHTAGFTMEAPYGNNFDLDPVTFEEHIQSISDTWLRFPVGTGYAYSNLGVDLAGYIVQKVSGQPFAGYVQDHLLLPLGMVNSSFDMAQVRANPNRAVGHTKPYPKMPLDIPIIPSGGFYASANDMARFIQFLLNQGSIDGQGVLDPALLDEMYTVPAPAQGSREGYALGVARTEWHRGREAVLFCHGGGGFGFLADLWWVPELKIGVTVLTNSTDHNLQGELALQQILYDFISDPESVYNGRLMALPHRIPVIDGDGHYRPPVGLARTIAQYALQPSDQDRLRWKDYVGSYSTVTWGVLDPLKALGRIYEQDAELYVQVSDTEKELQLFEVSPGLFFAENGEALDFRGPVPTWRNIKLTRIDQGFPLWQKAIVALCALAFLSGLLFFPLRGIVRRIRRAASSTGAPGRWAVLTPVLVITSSLLGLLSIGILIALPYIIYAGFIGWLDLPLGLKLLLHAPLALAIIGAALVILNVVGWKNHWWSRGERFYFLAFGLASVAMVLLLGGWRLIGLG